MKLFELLNIEALSHHCCDSSEKPGSEILINNFINLGGIPHCQFPELSASTFIFSCSHDTSINQLELFTTCSAFKNKNNETHVKVALSKLLSIFNKLNVSSIIFYNLNGSSLSLSNQELSKLIQVSKKIGETTMNDFEEIELNEGEEIVFSTPEPELPEDFIDYLSKTLSGIPEIEEAFVFDTKIPGEQQSSLVIGVVFKEGVDAERFDNLAYVLIEGIQQFVEDRELIDFMVLDDDELIEIARSVSPEIFLSTQ